MATTLQDPTIPGSVATSGAGPSELLLGPGAEFEGKLTFRGTVRIDARFKGSIVTDDVLVVGEHARIDADITCGTVIVFGEVNGNVRAKDAIEVRRSGKLRGNVETRSLSLEKGGILHGESRMMGASSGEWSSSRSDRGAGKGTAPTAMP